MYLSIITENMNDVKNYAKFVACNIIHNLTLTNG